MRDCKQCGKPVDGLECPYCGYSETGRAAKAKAPRDPMHLACHWITDGQRCAELGVISPATHGEGPWYCQPHYDRLMGWDRGKGKVVPPPAGFEELKSVLKRKFPAVAAYEREPGEDD